MRTNVSKVAFVNSRGTGCSQSGVISALEQDSGRAGIRSERSHGWRSERSACLASDRKGICRFPAKITQLENLIL